MTVTVQGVVEVAMISARFSPGDTVREVAPPAQFAAVSSAPARRKRHAPMILIPRVQFGPGWIARVAKKDIRIVERCKCGARPNLDVERLYGARSAAKLRPHADSVRPCVEMAQRDGFTRA